ncbi:MAG: sulfite exporter TauE/SafE family protein [Flavobacteriales bacterium]|nr:sulfite exporter TauE/SafE family protein [Flavobacteriales bacterium]
MELYYSALAFGFLGGVHCLGMCGPIAFALPVNRENKLKGTFQSLIYQFGRLITYSVMGFIFGTLGKGFSLAGIQQYLSIAMGAMMIIVVLWPSQKIGSIGLTGFVYKHIGKLKSKLGELLKRRDTKTLFVIGILNGALPCGLVYMALIGAVATGSSLEGGIYMFVFGVGTIPFMFGATMIGNFMSMSIRNKVQKAIPVFVVIIGLLFILRGLGLGIPFLSPPEKKLHIQENQTEMKCGGMSKCGGK